MKLQEGWLTFLLLTAMVVVAAWGVALARWSQGLWAAWFTGLTGVIAGLALAKSRFSGPWAAVVATVYGLFSVGFFIAASLDGTWHERSLELVTRMAVFVSKVFFGGTSRDALPFPVLVAAIFWLIGVVGAWAIFRRRAVWPAVLPGGIGLLINAYYYQGPAAVDLYLAVYLLLGLLLVGRVSLLLREHEWREAQLAFSPEGRLDFLRAGLTVALVGVIIGWAGPGLAASPAAASAWQEMSGPLGVVREQWARLFAAIRAYGSGQAVGDFYGDTLALGGAARLGGSPIMDVEVNPLDDTTPQAVQTGAAARFYWRLMVYDRYTDGRWEADGFEFQEYDPNRDTAQPLPAYRLRRDYRAAFTSYIGAASRLYVLPQPRWVSRPVMFGLQFLPSGTVEIGSVRSLQVLPQGGVYEALASVTVADAQSLSLAGQAYPAWTAGYLQLPPEVTQRTRDLALQIVREAGAQTPYAQALAVTNWLRQNIQYDLNIDAPPPEVEPVDYLLFESRQGYCNYYASAEVILLRSLGIPARLAVGMAQGELDEQTGIYHVREKDAHAWPEVFFPGYGWVEFEPTVSQPELLRPERPATADSSGAPAGEGQDDTGLESGRDQDRSDLLDPGLVDPAPPLNPWLRAARAMGLTVAVILGLALMALLAGALALVRLGVIGWENLGPAGEGVLRWRGLAVPSVVTVAYLHLERAARLLGLALSEAHTPHERGRALSAAVPEARSGVEAVTDQYVAERYSPYPADGTAAQSAWRGIRWPVWRHGLRTLVRRLAVRPRRRPDAGPGHDWH